MLLNFTNLNNVTVDVSIASVAGSSEAEKLNRLPLLAATKQRTRKFLTEILKYVFTNFLFIFTFLPTAGSVECCRSSSKQINLLVVYVWEKQESEVI